MTFGRHNCDWQGRSGELSSDFSSFATRSYSLAWPFFQLRLDDSTSISYRSPRISATSNELMKWQKRLNYQIILKQVSIFRGTHPHRVDLPRNVAVGKLPNAVLYTGRRGAQPGVKRPTTHSAFKLLVHDFVHRRRAYRGLCGSCVRKFAISYVE